MFHHLLLAGLNNRLPIVLADIQAHRTAGHAIGRAILRRIPIESAAGLNKQIQFPAAQVDSLDEEVV